MKLKSPAIFIIFLCFCIPAVINAQDRSRQDHQAGDLSATQDLWKASVILNPGIIFEKKIASVQTLVAHAYMATTAQIGWSSSMGNTSHLYLDPAISLEYRYYYNFERRERKGHTTEYNNGNYLSVITAHSITKSRLDAAYSFEYKRRLVNTFGFLYGIQRNYKNRFSLDIQAGLGYKYGSSSRMDAYGYTTRTHEGYVRMLADVGIGFWLSRRHD